MRNLFDQFQQPENQLSHALASVLTVNPLLCLRFVEWLSGKRVPERSQLVVVQQTIPGTVTTRPDPDERRGLPDICIHDGDWCLAIENKVDAPLTTDQLNRHRRSVQRAFETVEVAAITAVPRPPRFPDDIHHRTWEEVYCWLGSQLKRGNDQDAFWCSQLRDFMRAFEARQMTEGSEMKNPLTTFDGIPFGNDYPFNYREAKLLIRQAMGILRKRPALKKLGIDPACTGRPGITDEGTFVWDFMSLRPSNSGDKFTIWPHLTLGIWIDKIDVMLTIPNGTKARCIGPLRELGPSGFVDMCQQIAGNLERRFGKTGAFQPVLNLDQRHFLGQRKAVGDGRLLVDLRVANRKSPSGVKERPFWLESAYQLFTDKQGANVQLQLGAYFPYSGGLLNRIRAVEAIEAGWLSCKPAVDLLMAR